MRNSSNQSRPDARPTQTDRWAEYERLKAEWVARHPDATPAEYEAAMLEIARKLAL